MTIYIWILISLVITSSCLSGCIIPDSESTLRTFTYQSNGTTVPRYSYELILYPDGTFLLNSKTTRNFNHTTSERLSGIYTETKESIIIPTLSKAVYKKKGDFLIDQDLNTWTLLGNQS